MNIKYYQPRLPHGHHFEHPSCCRSGRRGRCCRRCCICCNCDRSPDGNDRSGRRSRARQLLGFRNRNRPRRASQVGVDDGRHRCQRCSRFSGEIVETARSLVRYLTYLGRALPVWRAREKFQKRAKKRLPKRRLDQSHQKLQLPTCHLGKLCGGWGWVGVGCGSRG